MPMCVDALMRDELTEIIGGIRATARNLDYDAMNASLRSVKQVSRSIRAEADYLRGVAERLSGLRNSIDPVAALIETISEASRA